MILGKEQPDEGVIKIGDTVNIVSVGQERMDELNSDKTVFDEISGGMEEIELGTQTVQSRAYLSWFGFKGAQQQAFVGNLSGGERNRAQLAKILKGGGNMIILDEVNIFQRVSISSTPRYTSKKLTPLDLPSLSLS
jgi:energy-dependent translational throttle protein EttA